MQLNLSIHSCHGRRLTQLSQLLQRVEIIFYKYENNMYGEEDGYFVVATVTVSCIVGMCKG